MIQENASLAIMCNRSFGGCEKIESLLAKDSLQGSKTILSHSRSVESTRMGISRKDE